VTADEFDRNGAADGRSVLRMERRYPHAVEKVWRAVTEPEHLAAWFPSTVSGDLRVDGELLQADQYVLALGSYSRALLLPLGLDLPVYPVKGYSLTVPLSNTQAAPVSTVLDETYKVALTRFDQRLRVGGMAELAGFDLALRPSRRETLALVTNELFPEAGPLSEATFWTGLRPLTPDGTPIVGETAWRNLWLNTGHGTLGWTMACGSGKLLADQISGQRPEIDTAGFSVARYKTRAHAAMPASVGLAGAR